MDPDELSLERGDPGRPVGSCFAYWEAEAEVDGAAVRRVIAVHFVVSPLAWREHTVAATFPPVLLGDADEIRELAERAGADVIRVDEVTIPLEGFDFPGFFRRQLDVFNTLVTAYSLAYARGIGLPTPGAAATDEGAPDPGAPDAGAAAPGPAPADERALRLLDGLAAEARAAYLASRDPAGARRTVLRMRRIANELNTGSYKYDVENLIARLSNPDRRVEELAGLFFRKFLAIREERYEDAEELKRRIDGLSAAIDRGEFH